MAALVAIALSHGCQPLDISPTGETMLQKKQIGGSDPEHH